jgi:hypothetical protein
MDPGGLIELFQIIHKWSCSVTYLNGYQRKLALAGNKIHRPRLCPAKKKVGGDWCCRMAAACLQHYISAINFYDGFVYYTTHMAKEWSPSTSDDSSSCEQIWPRWHRR